MNQQIEEENYGIRLLVRAAVEEQNQRLLWSGLLACTRNVITITPQLIGQYGCSSNEGRARVVLASGWGLVHVQPCLRTCIPHKRSSGSGLQQLLHLAHHQWRM